MGGDVKEISCHSVVLFLIAYNMINGRALKKRAIILAGVSGRNHRARKYKSVLLWINVQDLQNFSRIPNYDDDNRDRTLRKERTSVLL